jgi:predicted nuclease with TOPRIM domain
MTTVEDITEDITEENTTTTEGTEENSMPNTIPDTLILLQEATDDRAYLRGRLNDLEQELTADRNSIGLLTVDRESLQERLNYFSQRLDELKVERDSLERRLSYAGPELAAFKKRVVEVASKYADDHGWCGIIDQALEELGLERERVTYLATLTVTVCFRAELDPGRDLPSSDWVRESMQTYAIEQAVRDNFEMDSDHSSSSIDDIDFDVINVRNADDDS